LRHSHRDDTRAAASTQDNEKAPDGLNGSSGALRDPRSTVPLQTQPAPWFAQTRPLRAPAWQSPRIISTAAG